MRYKSIAVLIWLFVISCSTCLGKEKQEECQDCRKYMTEHKLFLKSPKKILREHKFKEWEQEKKEIVPVIINLNISSEDVGTDIHADMPIDDRIITQQNRILKTLLKNDKVKIRHIFQNIPSISCEMPATMLKLLILDPKIDSIEPIEVFKQSTAQGIPQIGGHIYRDQYTGEGISIAILDSGIDAAHPFLGNGEFGVSTAKIKGGRDYVGTGSYYAPSSNSDGSELNGHGTACAGIAAGNIDNGNAHPDYIGGVAHKAQFYSLRITDVDGHSTNDDAAAAIDWCITTKQTDSSLLVISMSFGGGQYSNYCDGHWKSYADAANRAYNEGIVLVAGSGNNGYTGAITSPACYSNVISVGAVYDRYKNDFVYQDEDAGTIICGPVIADVDKVACFSNSASILDVLAPSYSAATTWTQGNMTNGFSGTSAACPYVAGAIAVIQEASLDLTGRYRTPNEIRNILASTGTPILDERNGLIKPRINIDKAIQTMMYKIIASQSSNGRIDPVGDVYVKLGASKIFNAIPNTGYVVDRWEKNGTVVQTGGNTYTLTNVTSSCSIYVAFKQQATEDETITLYPTADVYIMSYLPTINSGNNTRLDLWWDPDPPSTAYGLIKFDLDSIPNGSTLNSAQLKLYCTRDDGIEISASNCGSDWNKATVCWNNKPPFGMLNTFSSYSGLGWWIWQSSQLEAVVQSWISNPQNNYGFYLLPGSITGTTSFYSTVASSNHPRLVVTYTPPPNHAPSIPSSEDPGDNTQGVSITTELDWSCSDPDSGDTVYYTVYFEKNDSSPDTIIKNDATGSYADPGTLDTDSHYYWKVRAEDHNGGVTESPVWDFYTVVATGSLQVTITPQEAIDAGAKWILTGEGLAYAEYSSGQVVSNIPVGSYQLSFKDIAGFAEPASRTIEMVQGNNVEAGIYSKIYSGGSGEPNNPFVISDANDLLAMRNNPASWGNYFVLANDIDLTGHIFTTSVIGTGPAFNGSFDGNGHKIIHLLIDGIGNGEWGLFGYIGVGGQVKNLGTERCSIKGGDIVGAIAGLNEGELTGCYANGSVSGLCVGGLVGGNLWGSISNCYSMGSVSGGEIAGGLVGDNGGIVLNCYAAVDVGGSNYVGGLIGHHLDNAVSNCFWDIDRQSHGVIESIGFIESGWFGNIASLSTAEMQAQTTYTNAGWDFVDTWRICDGTNYPKLAWQKVIVGDFVCPDGVDFMDYAVLAEQWMREKSPYDVAPDNGDGIVNFVDWAVFAKNWDGDVSLLSDFASQWLESGASCDIAPEPNGDGVVDMLDFVMFTENWLAGK